MPLLSFLTKQSQVYLLICSVPQVKIQEEITGNLIYCFGEASRRPKRFSKDQTGDSLLLMEYPANSPNIYQHCQFYTLREDILIVISGMCSISQRYDINIPSACFVFGSAKMCSNIVAPPGNRMAVNVDTSFVNSFYHNWARKAN